MVSELRDHLVRHLQGVEKKKIEQTTLDYISKLVGCAFSPNFNPTPCLILRVSVSEPVGFCAYVYALCVHTCVCWGGVPMGMWRPEVDFKCHPPSLYTLVLETGPLTDPGSH